MTDPYYNTITGGGVIVFIGQDPVKTAVKAHELVALAAECCTGRLGLIYLGDAIEVIDHEWLMRLASVAASEAADKL